MNADYCTNHGAPTCWDCPLCKRGRDCRGKSIAHRDAGAVRSEAKAAAARANGAKGGRPRKRPQDGEIRP